MAEKLIGILFADDGENGLTHDFFSGILDGFKKYCEKHGYQVMFLNVFKNSPGRLTYLEQAKNRKLDGVVVACINYADPEVMEIIRSGIPVVTIDEAMDGVISILSDNVSGMKELVDYISSMGHKRIAFICGDLNTVTNLRINAFREACDANGIEVTDDMILPATFRDMSKTAYLTEELLRMQEPPSCIIFPDDYAAIGGINVIRARGLDIPADVSVAGYDGLNIPSQYEPRITTVKQDTFKIGETAGEKLIELIEDPSTKIVDYVVPTTLSKGRTIGKVYF